MARRNVKIQPMDPFLGGLDVDSAPFDVHEDCFITCANVLPSLSVGGITVRNGIAKHNTVATQESGLAKASVGIFSFYDQGSVTEYFIKQAGTKFYNNTPEGTWADITGALVLTDSINNLTSFDVLANIVYMANRLRDTIWQWPRSGNGVALVAQPTGGGQFVVSFNRRLFVGGNGTNPLLVYYSAIDDGTSYTVGTDFLNFDEGQGSKITGMVRQGSGRLLVFKEKSITIVESTGTTPPFTKYLFVDGIGCVSHQSIVTLPGGIVMFWDNDDAYVIIGNQVLSATTHPTTKRPRLRNFFRDDVNKSRLQYTVGVYYPLLDIVRFFYASSGSTSQNAHIDYHVKTRSWWTGTLRGTSCCVRLYQGQVRLYAGDTNGFDYRQDFNTNDDGSAIIWNARLPWQVHEGITIRKKLDLIYTVIDKQSNYDVLCDVYIDNSITAEIVDGVLSTFTLSGSTWDVSMFDVDTFPAEGNLLEASLNVSRLYKSVSIDIHGSNLDQPVNIHKVVFIERPLELTRLTS